MSSMIALMPTTVRGRQLSVFVLVSALTGIGVLLVSPVVARCVESSASRPTLVISRSCLHEPMFRRLLDGMADGWKLERTLAVRELSDRAMDQLVARSAESESEPPSTVDGCYTDKPDRADFLPTITLRSGLSAEEASFVFAHEYGHYLWNRVLTISHRQDYAKIWDLQKRRGRNLTAYSIESSEEGFSEAFALLQLNEETLRRRDPQSWGYLDQLEQQLSRAAVRRYVNR